MLRNLVEHLIRRQRGHNLDTATLDDVMAVGDQLGRLVRVVLALSIRVEAIEDAVQRDRGEMAVTNGQDDQP